MPQSKPKPKFDLRGRVKLPTPKVVRERSLFEEHPYAFFAGSFVCVTLLAKAGGMSLRDALVLGAWLVSIAFFVWQVLRYRKEKSTPVATRESQMSREQEVAKNSRIAQKPVVEPAGTISQLTVSDTMPPRWPPPPPRLVSPLSVTLAKKAQEKQKAQEEQNPKPEADKNPKP